MKLELERKDLEALVKGNPPYYDKFGNHLGKMYKYSELQDKYIKEVVMLVDLRKNL